MDQHAWYESVDDSVLGPSCCAGPLSVWRLGDRYKAQKTLGKGAYGQVALAEDLKTNGNVAIKRITSHILCSTTDLKRVYREIRLNHDNIIKLHNAFSSPSSSDTSSGKSSPKKQRTSGLRELYFVFQAFDMDIGKLLRDDQNISNEHVQKFLYQLLRGVQYLHARGVIHRDIKPDNILTSVDCELALCDFGLSRLTSAPQLCAGEGSGGEGGVERMYTEHVVTRWYRAPELILLCPYSTPVDLWSVGCVFAELLEMLPDTVPFKKRQALFPGDACVNLSPTQKEKYRDQLEVILQVIGTPSSEDIAALQSHEAVEAIAKHPTYAAKSLSDRYAHAPPEAIDLLKQLLIFNPHRRATAVEAMKHPYLADLYSERDIVHTDTTILDASFDTGPNIDWEEKIFEELGYFSGIQ